MTKNPARSKQNVPDERNLRPFKYATPELAQNVEMIEQRFPTLNFLFKKQLALSITPNTNGYGCLYDGQQEEIEKMGLADYLNMLEATIQKMYKDGTFPRTDKK